MNADSSSKHNLFQLQSVTPPWIIAHRGYRSLYPENTMIAFRAALDAGVQMVELDVVLSRDRKLIVIHDAALERTTNGKGLVKDHSMEELKQLDAGSWFDPRFAGERLPILEEALELLRGRALINIEIKWHAYEPDYPPDAIERQVVELVRRKKMQDCSLISSFESKILEHIAAIEDAPALSLISKYPADRSMVGACRRIKIFSWHPNHKILTHDQVKMMHAAGIKVFPYNVDTTKDYERMLKIDVDGMIVSDPYMMKSPL